MEYSVGQIVEGEITGIQPYGAFVKFDNQFGLIHISEISLDYIKDINHFLSLHQKIKVKILESNKESGHYKLSLKALQDNSTRERRKYYGVAKLPEMKIGFKTVEENLEHWIEEAKNK